MKDVKINLILRKDGKDVQELNIIDINKDGKADSLAIEVEKNGEKLRAEIYPDDSFPSIVIEGVDARGNNLAIADAELPNEDYPTQICARLYAGYIDQFEPNDGPVARVVSDIRDEEYYKKRLENAESRTPEIPRKVVHVDYDIAAVSPDQTNTEHEGY